MTPSRASLDRPPGTFLRGTSLGLLGLIALAVGIPFGVLDCMAPLVPGGFGLWLHAVPYVLALGLLPVPVLIAPAPAPRCFWPIRRRLPSPWPQRSA